MQMTHRDAGGVRGRELAAGGAREERGGGGEDEGGGREAHSSGLRLAARGILTRCSARRARRLYARRSGVFRYHAALVPPEGSRWASRPSKCTRASRPTRSRAPF